MKRTVPVRSYLCCVVATLVVAAALQPGRAGAADRPRTAALGPCWTNNTRGFGQDSRAAYYATTWRAGQTQTIIKGTAPNARYWSITLYPGQLGKIITFYDRQLANGPGASYTLTIGGARPRGTAAWVDPSATGSGTDGVLLYRIYRPNGTLPPLPDVAYRALGKGGVAPTSCSSVIADLNATLARANVVQPSSREWLGRMWPRGNPFHSWSVPSLVQPIAAYYVPIYGLGDPNDVYHFANLRLVWGDMVLRGVLPPISDRAPATGMRYFSICAYPSSKTTTYQTLSCVDDTSIVVDARRRYTIVVSPDQPQYGETWLNTGSALTGVLVMRWLLPKNGSQASFCLPAIAYRQPGENVVPDLPYGC